MFYIKFKNLITFSHFNICSLVLKLFLELDGKENNILNKVYTYKNKVNAMISEKISPFEPGKPVSSEKFEGRSDIINDFTSYLSLAVNGEPQHFYLHGNSGVGKSSLANYLLEYARIKYNMVGVHVCNEEIHNLDDLINNIVEKLLNEVKNENFGKKILNLFAEYVENGGFLGSYIKFRPKTQQVTWDIKDSFLILLLIHWIILTMKGAYFL